MPTRTPTLNDNLGFPVLGIGHEQLLPAAEILGSRTPALWQYDRAV
ncbi:MAG: hypothetical protein WA824_08640 [Candidatus Sulfotelmatobacter sp.]